MAFTTNILWTQICYRKDLRIIRVEIRTDPFQHIELCYFNLFRSRWCRTKGTANYSMMTQNRNVMAQSKRKSYWMSKMMDWMITFIEKTSNFYLHICKLTMFLYRRILLSCRWNQQQFHLIACWVLLIQRTIMWYSQVWFHLSLKKG